MFAIGDLIIYSGHGLCRINDIRERSFLGETKMYYELQPVENHAQLKISIPVDNEKVVMLELLDEQDANAILETFKRPGVEWIDNPNLRLRTYSDIVNKGDRNEIAKVVNTLIRMKNETEFRGKKLDPRDYKLLNDVKSILFKELAMSLKTTFDEINTEIMKMIKRV
ncbi:CarD family transcriptional regulator [Sporosarcina sp. ACRSL]|uniref:CarD family transcriptional regulator n=1 Tax=Sporosarcina sp. ACRSL TaxID=2918215 RepID=UPI001EF465D8|nr:CarD family transcriptional regulator [Sporosarcina sp. ACRSL]MCG7343586.1 CarD family transcriptional regulator [Sporosarcina sp. ACRSL]